MAVQISTAATELGSLYVDSAATSTAEANLTGSASGVLYNVSIDNTANPSTDVYVKIYDHANPTNSTVAPMIFPCLAGTAASYTIPGGFAFSTALSFLCTDAAATGSGKSPSNGVIVAITAT